MKRTNAKPAVTLIEMIIVIGVIALLAGVVVSVATRIDNQAKENLTRSTITLIGNALEQFEDFGWTYFGNYVGLDFPLDFNDFLRTDMETAVWDAMGQPANVTVELRGVNSAGVDIGLLADDPNSAACEGMCFYLNQVPRCREILDQIDESLIKADGTVAGVKATKVLVVITPTGEMRRHDFHRIVDAWGMTLRYDYYPGPNEPFVPSSPGETYLEHRNRSLRTFPMVTSAGPDTIFGTEDDISNAGARR
jgi:hypothetical protein